jgi:hypothetical protein
MKLFFALIVLASFVIFAFDPREPVLFGEGSISTPEDETGFALSPDGKEAWFTISTPATSGPSLDVICVSRLIAGKWSIPEVAPFSGKFRDLTPALSPDGSKLFFVSNRTAAGDRKRDLDIWFVTRTASGWTEARPLGPDINSTGQEYGVSVAANGALYFGSTREGGAGSYDIYRSEFRDGVYQPPVALGPAINTEGAELMPAISPDESILVFTAFGREDELIGVHQQYNKGDLYISFKKDGVWGKARNVGAPVNSGAGESAPSFSADGKTFFFISERGFATYRQTKPLSYQSIQRGLTGILNGMGNVYRIDSGVFLR